MPEASAACYEEFLHGVEAQEGVELPSPSDTVANAEECADQPSATQPPSSPNTANLTGGFFLYFPRLFCDHNPL